MTVDDSEKVRGFFNNQYVKMKKMAAVGSLILLAVNLAFTVYPYIEFRFPEEIWIIPRAWVGVPLVFIFIMILIWFFAHIYIKIFEMYRTETRADMMFNPFCVYAFGPFEEMLWRNVQLPTLEAAWASMPDGERKDKIKKELDKARKWVEMGYIPKEDFPKHLRKYYITNKQQRLF